MLKVSTGVSKPVTDVELHELYTSGIDYDLELHCMIMSDNGLHLSSFRVEVSGIGWWGLVLEGKTGGIPTSFSSRFLWCAWNPGLADNTPVTKSLVLSCGLASVLVGTQGGVRVFSLSYQVLVSDLSILYVWFVMFCRCCRQNWSLIRYSGIFELPFSLKESSE